MATFHDGAASPYNTTLQEKAVLYDEVKSRDGSKLRDGTASKDYSASQNGAYL